MLTLPTDYSPPKAGALDLNDFDSLAAFVVWIYCGAKNNTPTGYIVFSTTIIEMHDMPMDCTPEELRRQVCAISDSFPEPAGLAVINMPGVPLMVWHSTNPDNYKVFD